MEMFTSPRPRGRPPGTQRATVVDERLGLPVSAPSKAYAPTVVKPIHEALAELLIADPGLNAAALGAKLNRHPVTIRLILRSDLFRELMVLKRAQFVDPKVEAKVEELFDVAIAGSLECLTKAVDESQSTDLALKTLAAIGPMSKYGARTPPPAVQANFIVPMPPKAASTAAWEAQVTEVLHGGRAQTAP
jgi:hypothetical protein